MAAYAKLTANDIKNAQCTDMGVTFSEGDYSERTIIVRGEVDGSPIAAAVLLDASGQSMDSPEAFAVEGINNFEMAARLFADEHELSDSYCALIESDFRTIAEQFAS